MTQVTEWKSHLICFVSFNCENTYKVLYKNLSNTTSLILGDCKHRFSITPLKWLHPLWYWVTVSFFYHTIKFITPNTQWPSTAFLLHHKSNHTCDSQLLWAKLLLSHHKHNHTLSDTQGLNTTFVVTPLTQSHSLWYTVTASTAFIVTS